MTLLGPVLWLLATLATGDRLLAWLAPRPRTAVGHLSLSFLLGLAGSTLLAFWLNLLGVPLAPWLPAAVALPFLVLAALGRRPAWLPDSRPSLLALFLLLLFVGLPLAKSLWEPLKGWDARVIYGNYTALLVHEQSVRGEGFTDPSRSVWLVNYPLLLPLAQWQVAGWMGGMEDHAMRILFPLCELAMLGCVWSSLARRAAAPWPELATACAAGVPFLYAVPDGSVPSGYADVPLAALVAGFGALAWDWLDEPEDPGPLWLLTLLAAGMAFTKRGGLLIALLGLALLLVMSRRRGPVLASGLAMAAMLAPWWLHQRALTFWGSQNYAVRLYEVAVERKGLESNGLLLLLRALADTFLRPGHQALFWWAFAAALPGALRGDRGVRLLALLVLGTALGTWLFLLRSGEGAELLNAYSWGRYTLPLLPLGAMVVGAVAGRGGRS